LAIESRARERVASDEQSAKASGVLFTPTFFINGRRYEGLWEESSFADAMLGSLGHRVRSAALDFARWAPSAGVLLLLATIAAILFTNSPLGPAFAALWEEEIGVSIGDRALRLSLLHWINDGLLVLFFFVVGLEIKRELTVGHLSSRRLAALPVAAALGGMAAPVTFYLLSIGDGGPWSRGWGVPMATDTAFAVALIVVMGSRVPIALRIFLTAAAIVDDIGAITVVAFFYSHELQLGALAGALLIVVVLALLHRASVYTVTPYVLLGVLLWLALLTGGLHATMAGVLLAMFIPTRPPPNLDALQAQASAVLAAEIKRGGEVLQNGPSEPALHALDAIHDRLESPADRLLRHLSLRSSYAILPLFALANAGVALDASVLDGRESLFLAIVLGLVVGKPVGILAASWLAVRLGLATKPDEYDWRQVLGAGALAGIGFTMSLFIAGEAFPAAADFATAKIAVFTASILSAAIGVGILWRGSRAPAETEARSEQPIPTPSDVTAL
jgi:NhaA family Na+:H+ antiporter